MKPRDIPVVIEMIREHAEFERAEAPLVSVQSLRAAIFGRVPPLLAWLADSDDGAVGYMTATHDFSTWRGAAFLHMDCLYVRASFRNAGVGARLMDVLRKCAAAHHIEEIQWQTPTWNSDAARFYSRTGATENTKRRFTLKLSR